LEKISEILIGQRDLQRVPWQNLRFEHVTALRSQLIESGQSPASVNACLYALRGVAKACWNLELMSAEDYARIKNVARVRGSRLPAGRSLASGELTALMGACCADSSPAGARDAALLGLLYTGGMRRAEVAALQKEDFDADSGALKVRGKGDKERLVYVLGAAAHALEDWLAHRGGEDGPLFVAIRKNGALCRKKGVSDQAIYNVLHKRALEAGVKHFSPHDLRRTFVGDLLERGVDIVTVQNLAGHANVSTTARYDRRGEATKIKATATLHLPYRARG
jgi:site-specific recombinase XerD